MLTNFGKEIRKIRIDRSHKLLDMANKLEVSSSFLSAIERGRKKVPIDFVKRITESYNLSASEVIIINAALEKDVTSFTITPANDVEHETVAMFARNIKTLPNRKLKKIQDILKSEDS